MFSHDFTNVASHCTGLPQTGDSAVLLYAIVGIAVVAALCAVVALVVRKRRAKTHRDESRRF